MAYKTVCASCGKQGQFSQARGHRLKDYSCRCGGLLKRIGWQEMYRLRAGTPTAAEAAVLLLLETNNPAIQWGDSRLLHDVATRIGLPHEGPNTEKRVLDLIEKTNSGLLIKDYVSHPARGLSRVRRYSLPTSVASTN